MANPNIVNVTSIFGKLATLAVDSDPSAIVTNAGGEIIKVNSLSITNNTSADSDGTIDVFINKSTGTDVYIARDVVVPDAATLVVLSKDNGIYLESADELQLRSNPASGIEAACSYEIIS